MHSPPNHKTQLSIVLCPLSTSSCLTPRAKPLTLLLLFLLFGDPDIPYPTQRKSMSGRWKKTLEKMVMDGKVGGRNGANGGQLAASPVILNCCRALLRNALSTCHYRYGFSFFVSLLS